ncbi:hypothetical protein [Spirosoma oryzae]|uniref:hypothetical protein n=1 Tax=Spirosoma oryzae TaxID=1469603 RepID=UPI001B809778|nr:hypothetical protein [Spirosoma oryzae]
MPHGLYRRIKNSQGWTTDELVCVGQAIADVIDDIGLILQPPADKVPAAGE